METLLDEIIESFGLPEKPKSGPVPRDRVLAWMETDDVEALGALYAYLMKADYSRRVFPALMLSDYLTFVPRYLERCFHENPDGEWSHGRYAAAWDFASWFGTLWRDRQIDKKELVRLKNWLGGIYKNGNAAVRRCIIDGTLEHLFENREIARFFTDWKDDPLLMDAYAEALQWKEGG